MSGKGSSHLPLLVALLSALIFVIVYMYVFVPKQESIERLREANAKLAEELSDLHIKTDNQEYFRMEAERLRGEIAEIYSYFPADVQVEDAIVTAQEVEDQAPALISSIGFVPSATMYTVGEGVAEDMSEQIEESQANAEGDLDTTLEEDVMTAQEGGATTYSEGAEIYVAPIQLPGGYEGEFGPIVLRNAVTTLNFETSYEGMKNLVDYFARTEKRTTIAQINLAYDSNTGLLNGSTTINRYSMLGTGAEYELPVFNPGNLGTSNIFGTITIHNNESGLDLRDYSNPGIGGAASDTGEITAFDENGNPITGEAGEEEAQ